MRQKQIGISGFSAFIPAYRVSLERWCSWTGNSWEKTSAVIGSSFRLAGLEHNAYTMAANAVLRLIDDHQIDPQKVGFLALGTESSTDNATSGAVIVRGLIDQALRQRGMQALARDIECPELKQACLGGIYGLKAAARYLAVDGTGRSAIVVASDIAEYERGSSGEPTQGAGAVAMLLESDPKLLTLDLHRSASSTSYRAVDFRKPFLRYCNQSPENHARVLDFPVFNGKYSTACYTDETMSSLKAFFLKNDRPAAQYLRDLGAIFMHRPYKRMPISAWTLGYLLALSTENSNSEELAEYARESGISVSDFAQEMQTSPDLLNAALKGELIEEPYPLASRLAKAFRNKPRYKEVVEAKMQLGSALMAELGNLYSAALPAWVAAGLQEAATREIDLNGKDILLIGYGSGNASEVMPAQTVAGWEHAAKKTSFEAVLAEAVDLDMDQYAALHDCVTNPNLKIPAKNQWGFFIDRTGTTSTQDFSDYGIEYYRYVPKN